MKWSWKVGRIAGIEVFVHATFLILLGWVALSHYLQRRSWEDALGGLGFILALFGIVVLHELGHALTARRFGIRTRDITLLPIGGVARLERMPEKPAQELLVALAGPAVNVVLALILLAILIAAGEKVSAADVQVVGGHVVATLMWVNVTLAVFNLLPAFPMDGGRVLRALLAIRMDYVHATEIAARIGQGMAFIFGAIGLFTNPFLVFIALFVWMGAAQEAGMVQMKSVLGNVPVSRVMITDFRALLPGDSLARVVEHILAGSQEDFPVLENGGVVGVLTRTDVLKGLTQSGPQALVGDTMQRTFETASPSEMAEAAFARLQSCPCRVMPVVGNEQLVGMLAVENLGEFMMIQAALKSRQQSQTRHGGDSTTSRSQVEG